MHRGFTCTTEQLVDISEIDSTLAPTATWTTFRLASLLSMLEDSAPNFDAVRRAWKLTHP